MLIDPKLVLQRYFFDFRHGDGLEPDEVGVELPDIDSAHHEALRALAAVAGEMMERGRHEPEISIGVRDATGLLLLEVAATFRSKFV